MIWFCFVLFHINHCRLFNANSTLYIHIKYIWFSFVGFYGISTFVGNLIPNPFYILYIWFGLVLLYGISINAGCLMPNLIELSLRVSSIAIYQYQFNWASVIYLHTVKWSNSSIFKRLNSSSVISFYRI